MRLYTPPHIHNNNLTIWRHIGLSGIEMGGIAIGYSQWLHINSDFACRLPLLNIIRGAAEWVTDYASLF